MTIVSCRICKKEFYAKPSHIHLGYGKYCSNICKREAQKTGKFIECYICNKKVWRTPKDIRRSASGYFFCSRKCSMSWKNSELRSGINHPLWHGGISTYRRLKEKNGGKMICGHCGLSDSRVLVVHHTDFNRQNNKLNNLQWLCRNCHYLAHGGKTI
jgi:hypothetical protein